MRRAPVFALFVLASISARAEPVSAIGTWRGQSLCTVKPSACRDETVVYHFAHGKAADTRVVTANKIVDGKEEPMGVIDCTARDGGHELSCPIPKGVWQFRIDGRALSGTLTLSGGQLFRRVSATRAD